MLRPELRLIHLQLTLNCNLRCAFCGQWGKYGYMKKAGLSELSTEDWLKVIDQASDYRAATGIAPEFILWGGEPLVSPAFVPVAERLRQYGFTTALVTNGVLLKDFAAVINRTVDTVYVSLDGPPEIHENIRGRAGIFEQIMAGVELLDKSRLSLVNLFTLCEQNYHIAAEFPFMLGKAGFKKMLIQNLIHTSPRRATAYRQWLAGSFQQEASNLDSWVNDHFGDWINALPEVIRTIQSRSAAGEYPLAVELYPGELNADNLTGWFDPEIELKQNPAPCAMPYRHLHINPDGESHFCVDFNDFSLGNIRNGLRELFFGEKAARFRAEYGTCNKLCARCPWYYNRSLTIDK